MTAATPTAMVTAEAHSSNQAEARSRREGVAGAAESSAGSGS